MTEEKQNKTNYYFEELIAVHKENEGKTARRLFMSAERTLASWIRTALSTMAFGITIDKLVLNLMENLENLMLTQNPQLMMKIIGGISIGISILFTLFAGSDFSHF